MCGEGRAGKREANGKSREEEMHEWVRIGRCRIWNGVGLRSGWGGTEHDEVRGGARRAVRTERGTWEKIREWMVFVWVRGLVGLCGWVLLGASES